MCKHFFVALNDRASTIKFNDAAEKFRLVELVVRAEKKPRELIIRGRVISLMST
jgi:hypothetical protein